VFVRQLTSRKHHASRDKLWCSQTFASELKVLVETRALLLNVNPVLSQDTTITESQSDGCTSDWLRFGDSCFRRIESREERDHEVSILMSWTGAVARYRGVFSQEAIAARKRAVLRALKAAAKKMAKDE